MPGDHKEKNDSDRLFNQITQVKRARFTLNVVIKSWLYISKVVA